MQFTHRIIGAQMIIGRPMKVPGGTEDVARLFEGILDLASVEKRCSGCILWERQAVVTSATLASPTWTE